MTLTPGTRLGHYEIVDTVGSGGMGQVYRARDTKLGRDVAIKVLQEELASDPDRLRRFEQEARAASALNHPNIITIHDIRLEEDVNFIVMEFVEGETLRVAVSRGPLPPKDLHRFAVQIAEGLAKAHSAEIVHRDLKPENLMISSDGFVKILDFGLAKLRDPSAEADSEAATVTREGTVLGTVGYMSPEQAKGQSADHRSDQFSLGAILYEMATGKRAFGRESPVQTLSAIIEREPESIAELAPNLAAHFRVIVNRCLAKRPEDRYDSTRDLARDLASVDIASPTDSIVPRESAREREIVSVEGKDKVSVAQQGKGLKIHVEEGDERIDLEIPARHVYIPVVVILVVVIALLLGLNVCGLRDRILGGASPPRIESLAVLPLENLSGDPEQEYFVDGMTEALIADLAQIKALKVISRTSAMRYKDTDQSVPAIARELHVDGVIEGSVLRAGDRVRITVQLIHAPKDQHVWANSYERDLRNILSLQKEVARAVASEIQIRLTQPEQDRLLDAEPLSPEAYEIYLKGRWFWNKWTEEALWKGIEHFNEAIELNPNNALAFAGLADSYVVLSFYSQARPKDVMPKAKTAALRALELDERLSEAHASLAFVLTNYDWDWHAAEAEHKRAIELNPGSVTAHLMYMWFLVGMARFDEAHAEIRKAYELSPLDVYVNRAIADVFLFAGRYDEAVEAYQEAIEMDPSFTYVHFNLGRAYHQKSMYDEALAAFQSETRISKSPDSVSRAWIGIVHASVGRRDEALAILTELEQRFEREYIPPSSLAWLHFALGQNDDGFKWLATAYEERDGWLATIRTDPAYTRVRREPRFEAMLRKMGLVP